MGLREQNKADLALAALTLTVTAAVAGYEAVRWARQRRRTHRRQPPAAGRPPQVDWSRG
jgi:hypothetical protein